MNKSQEMIEELEQFSQSFAMEEITEKGIIKEFTRMFNKLDIDGVRVSSVFIDPEGEIFVSFEDFEGDTLDTVFLVDPETSEVLVMLLGEEEDDEVMTIDLTAMNPSVLAIQGVANFVDLTNLSWLNKSTLVTILQVGNVGMEDDDKPAVLKKQDAFGNHLAQDLGFIEGMDEASVIAVRGGKKIRIAIVRRTKKKILSAKQKAGIRKAVQKRKAKAGQTKIKRKRSLKIRKQTGIKNRKSSSNLKIQGGRNR